MKRIILCFLVASAFVLSLVVITSCDKEDEYNNLNTTKLLESFVWDGDYEKYEYDNLNRITGILCFNKNGKLESFEEFSYYDNDLIEYLFGWPESEYILEEYNKVENKIIRTVGNVVSSIYLNSNGLPTISEAYNFEGDYTDGKPRLTYEFQNENLIKLTISDKIRDYEYANDDKKSPFYHCKSPKWFMFYRFGYLASKNNVIGGNYIKVDEYVYDNDGSPIKCTVTDNDNEKSSIEFKYKIIN